ncbi:hypothetical protein STEG23_003876, partial [Scotinomys teguina]
MRKVEWGLTQAADAAWDRPSAFRDFAMVCIILFKDGTSITLDIMEDYENKKNADFMLKMAMA